MIRICYLRITKSGWSKRKQEAAFAKADISIANEIMDNVYIEAFPKKKSAVRFPVLAEALNLLRKGDEFVIASHHILGGGNYLLPTVEAITKKGAVISVLEDGKRYGAKDILAFAKLAMAQVTDMKGRVGLASRTPDKMGGRTPKFTKQQQVRIAEIWREPTLTQVDRIALMKVEGMKLSVGTANRIALKLEAKRKPARKTRAK